MQEWQSKTVIIELSYIHISLGSKAGLVFCCFKPCGQDLEFPSSPAKENMSAFHFAPFQSEETTYYVFLNPYVSCHWGHPETLRPWCHYSLGAITARPPLVHSFRLDPCMVSTVFAGIDRYATQSISVVT